MSRRTAPARAAVAGDPPSDACRRRWIVPALLAAIAYLPLLATAPGRVGGDTKAYLTLDPARLLARAPWLWQPEIGTGTVTHQNIGYLWPMGPWFWVSDTVGLPMWVAQRLWLGSILFGAGLGTWWLVRHVVDRRLALVAALFYMLSPYALHYSERMSVLLLPWAGLPWMLGLTARAFRRGGWRDPALFALLTMSIGGINATSIVLVGLAPVLWLAHLVVVPAAAGTLDLPARERRRRALAVALRIGVLTVGTAAWWAAGLGSQGAYGLPILRYTETYETVANASTAPEALRGLGHWYFYGRDRIGPWVVPSTTYTENLLALTVSFVVPALALAGFAWSRFRHRAFFGLLIVVGTIVAVGSHPFDSPSPYGALFKAFTSSDTGLAMRSTPRALPLVVLGLAVSFAAGVQLLGDTLGRLQGPTGWLDALARHGHRALRVAACVLVVANAAPLWQGTMAASTLRRDEDLPQWWLDAAADVDAAPYDTRVLELPGIDFATYRWGNVVDPLTPGLIDRPYLARELVPNGSPASAALLLALDRRYQEGVEEPAALAPIARLLGVGDIILRNDLQYERFNTPRPYAMRASLAATPGLEAPREFGPAQRNDAPLPQPLLDAKALAEPAGTPATSPVAVYGVRDPLPIVRLVPADRPMIVAGDAEGLVDLAAEGLLDPERAVLFAASYAGDVDALRAEIARGATLVVTDTNAKRGLRWGTIRENTGYVERADESLLDEDPTDNRLEVFPDAGSASQTVVRQEGGTVWASAYGNPVSLTPEDRPALAFDGDAATAWRVGAFSDPLGERIAVDLEAPRRLAAVRLLQPEGNRHITKIALTVGGVRRTFDLGETSWSAPGQVVTFDAVEAARVELEILETDAGGLASYDGYSGVGFAEVAIDGVQVRETRRLPTDLLDAVGTDDLAHRLVVIVTRERVDASAGARRDPEAALAREVTLPSARSFAVSGTARLAPGIDDVTLDALLRAPAPGTATLRASSWLPGDLTRAAPAFDADAATWWTPSMSEVRGAWVEATAPAAIGVAAGDVRVRFAADGRHSVPAAISVLADGRVVGRAEVPDAPDGAFGTTRTVDVPVAPGTSARTWRVVIDEVHERITPEWLGTGQYALPPALAAVEGLPVVVPALRATVDTGCRSDLVQVGGRPVGVRITGSTATARERGALEVTGCEQVDAAAGVLSLSTTPGTTTGLDVDRLVLTSPGRRWSEPDTPPGGATIPRITGRGRDHVELEIDAVREPTWLVLGQSENGGWRATSPELGDLGGSRLVSGYANGWLLEPHDGPVRITLRWTPQRVVWVGLAVSALTALVCLLLVVASGRRRTGAPPPVSQGVDAKPHAHDAAPTRPYCIAAGVAAGALALVVLPSWPLAAPAIGAATGLAAARGRRATQLLGFVAPACLLLAGAYTVVHERRGGYRTDFAWPQIFDRVHVLGVLAVVAVGALVVVEVVRTAAAARRSPSGEP